MLYRILFIRPLAQMALACLTVLAYVSIMVDLTCASTKVDR